VSDKPARSDESSATELAPLRDLRFCHLVLGVTDMARALGFYRDLLGMDIVFDQLISGEPFDAVLHAKQQQQGRVVGGLIGGLMVELLSLGGTPSPTTPTKPGIVGIQNISLSVTDLDATYRSIVAAGYEPDQKPFAIDRVRMFFVKDPDGTPVEFIELPHHARSSYEMHRGVPIVLGPQ
jgi:catechol 2,3-dioxygenase-like lactoylglutathione lyase family enzyme